VISDAAYDQLDPAAREKFARVRQGPQGGSMWQDRSTLPSEVADAANKSAADGKQPGSTPATGDKVKIGDYELSGEDVAMLMQTKAQADLKATQVPVTGDAYEARLPEAFKLPGNVDFVFDPTDPALADLRQLAKRSAWTQEEFSNVLAVHAAKEAASEAKFRETMKAELGKLGANATVRVTALETWLRGIVGDDLARNMMAGVFSEKQFRGLEVLANKFASQNVMPFRQDGREVNHGGNGPLSRLSEAEYDAMSASERFRISRLGN
jgi:hypothetical protein